jgi:hypothetical protein
MPSDFFPKFFRVSEGPRTDAISKVALVWMSTLAQVPHSDKNFTNKGATTMRTYRPFFIGLAVLIAAITVGQPTGAQPLSDQWSIPVNLNSLPNQIPINSTGNDQHPAISHDGLSLYFTSDREVGCGGLDIWVTRRASVNSPWGQPVNLDAGRLALGLPCVINSDLADGVPNLTPDGRYLFFNSFRREGCGGFDLYYSVRTNPGDDLSWQAPRNMNLFGHDASESLTCGVVGDPYLVNTPNSETGPLYFHDEVTDATVLYFTRSDQPTNMGDFDIYTTTLSPDGKWGPVVRENDLSTTPYRDTRTAIRHDGLEMILSTERPGFPANSDPRKLWSATRNSTQNPWLPPALIPYVYSLGQDGAPAMSADGNELYFFSSREGGAGLLDLFVSFRTLPVVRSRNVTEEAGNSCLAGITPSDLDKGSFDPAGGSLRFSLDPAGPFELGRHTVRLIGTDDHGVTNSAIASIRVVDRIPPVIAGAAVDKNTLWPPNHEMVDVTVSYTANDNCGVHSLRLSVSSNESSSNAQPDWKIIDAHHVRLRAERNGNGQGRVYTITIIATDAQGNASSQVVNVSVPRDRGGSD